MERGETISAKQAEALSRLWQAIAYVAELRAELSNDAAAEAIANGSRELIRGAHLLSPPRIEAVKKATSA
jgi:hypothetical protein